MTTLILAASPSQANWDQANAFEEGQQRVAIGKDPMPGPRSCFWRYGPVSGDPYINIAFPDAGTFYWGAAFSVPKGAKLHLEGSFPHARYMSLISYDRLGAPLDSVADYLIAPKPGASNPYLFGADRNSKQRGYKIEVVSEPLSTPIPWGVYQEAKTRDKIHAPGQAENGQQQLIYRIYAGDKNTDETAGSGLPTPVLTLADGKELRGQDVCVSLSSFQPLSFDQAALATPREYLNKLTEVAKACGGPAMPASNPPTWSKSSESMSRYAIYTGDNTVASGTNKKDGTFFANLDNQYVRTFINRKHGEVFVIRAKAPTTPKTYNGNTKFEDGDLRYWSWCSQQGYASGRVNKCLFDEQIPVDANGYYTLVLSRESDRPRNAINECGVSWLPIADVGDGTGDPDLSFLVLRNMLGRGEFKHAVQNIKSQETIQQDMGDYFPRARYTTVSSFETAVPCQVEKR